MADQLDEYSLQLQNQNRAKHFSHLNLPNEVHVCGLLPDFTHGEV